MPRSARVCAIILLTSVASCHHGATAEGGPPPPDARPFGAFASQQVVVTPAAFVRGIDSLGWVQGLGGSRAVARQLDSSIVLALDARGLAARWVLPSRLLRSFERNRTYATDPYQLAMEPLRSPAFVSGGRYGEPLSSQLRTMIALETEARYVLLPIELRFEKDGARMRAVLRAALVDPRSAEARWVGEVKGDAAAAPASALASVAGRLADLFAAP